MKQLRIDRNGTPDNVAEKVTEIHGKVVGSLSPANGQLLDRYTIELDIVPKDKPLTSLPRYAHLTGKQSFESTPDHPRTWDEIRGTGGQLKGTVIHFALSEEEIVHDELSTGTGVQTYFPFYGSGFLQTHETGHIIHNFALTPEQRTTVDQLYSARKADTDAKWLSPTSYTSANADEYFANSVAAFFGVPYSLGGDPDYSPDWLRENDPKMFELLTTVFPRAPGLQSASEATTPRPVPVPVARPPEWDTVRPDEIPDEFKPEQPPPPPPPERRHRFLLPLFGIVILLLLLGLGIFLFAGSGDDGDGEPRVAARRSPAPSLPGPVTTNMQFTQTVASVNNCPQGPTVGFDLSPKTPSVVIVDRSASTITVGTSNTVPYDPKTGDATITYADGRATKAKVKIAPDGRVTDLTGTSTSTLYPGCTVTLNTSAAPIL